MRGSHSRLQLPLYYGADFARSIKTEFPKAYKADLAIGEGNWGKLDQFTAVTLIINRHEITIINAYTQHHDRRLGLSRFIR